jgi:opine dehydrogenase
MMKVTIVGAGNGGLAAAADLSLRGFSITLFEFPKFEGSIEPIRKKGAIGLSTLPSTGLSGGFARPDRITTDMGEALEEADLILVVIPAFAHIPCAKAMAGHLKKGQRVVLMPGGFGGAILFSKYLEEANGPKEILIAESSTLPYACRKLDSTSVWIRGRKGTFDLAAYPSKHTDRVLESVKVLYPAVSKAENVLETGLNNLNPFIHPPIVLLNVGSTERANRVLFYHEGITPSVQRLIEGLDQERLALGAKLGLSLQPAHRVLLDHYGHQGATGSSFMEVAIQNPVYRWSEMPETIDSRYLTEDIPMSLIPICSMSKQVGTPSRLMETIIELSRQILGHDLHQDARTLKSLGLEGRSCEEMLKQL